MIEDRIREYIFPGSKYKNLEDFRKSMSKECNIPEEQIGKNIAEIETESLKIIDKMWDHYVSEIAHLLLNRNPAFVTCIYPNIIVNFFLRIIKNTNTIFKSNELQEIKNQINKYIDIEIEEAKWKKNE